MNLLKTLLFSTCLGFSSMAQTEWLFLQGQNRDDHANGIVVDSEGYIYVAGTFQGNVDFDPSGSDHLVSSFSFNRENFFIQKLDQHRNLIWVKVFGGNCTGGEMKDVHIDSDDNIYLCGRFTGTADFIIDGQGISIASMNSSDGFVTKINTDGQLLWAKTLQGQDIQEVEAITTDQHNNLYITGQYRGNIDLDPNQGTAAEIYNAGFQNANTFFAKWDSEGSFIWGGSFQGTHSTGTEIAVDLNSNVYVLGYYKGTMDIDPGVGSYMLQSDARNAHYIVKLDAGKHFLWAKSSSGEDIEAYQAGALIFSASVDSLDNLYVGGMYTGKVDLGYGASHMEFSNATYNLDVFVQKFTPDGLVSWTKTFGSLYSDEIYDIKTAPDGKLYLTGSFAGTVDFNFGYPGSIKTSQNKDIYLMSWNQDGSFNWIETFGGTCDYSNGLGVAYDNYGNVYGAGRYNGTIEDKLGQDYIFGYGDYDCLVYKVGGTTNVHEIEKDQITVYPNPVDSKIEISGVDSGKISIYTADGRFVNSFDALDNIKIDLSAFPAGIYQLVIHSGSESLTKKIVKI